jgi:hypothetical protein
MTWPQRPSFSCIRRLGLRAPRSWLITGVHGVSITPPWGTWNNVKDESKCWHTVRLGNDLVGLELEPAPVGELVGEDGQEHDLGDGARECLVKLRLEGAKA